MPALALLRVRSEAADPGAHRARVRHPGRVGRLLRSRWLAWSVTLLVSVSAAGIVALGDTAADRRADAVGAQLRTAEGRVTAAYQVLGASNQIAAELQARVTRLQERLEVLREANARTIVKTKTVTETITRWVPNGERVRVEITGFEGIIEIHDVRLTHSYGYSDLIGIAINQGGETISYAQLGCTFLAPDGRILANGIENKESWQPGQTWGFDCSAQVNATGGILRVDEMS